MESVNAILGLRVFYEVFQVRGIKGLFYSARAWVRVGQGETLAWHVLHEGLHGSKDVAATAIRRYYLEWSIRHLMS